MLLEEKLSNTRDFYGESDLFLIKFDKSSSYSLISEFCVPFCHLIISHFRNFCACHLRLRLHRPVRAEPSKQGGFLLNKLGVSVIFKTITGECTSYC